MRPLANVSLTVVMAVSGTVWSYAVLLAESHARLFAPVKGAEAAKVLHLMKPEAFLEKLKAKWPVLVIDI